MTTEQGPMVTADEGATGDEARLSATWPEPGGLVWRPEQGFVWRLSSGPVSSFRVSVSHGDDIIEHVVGIPVEQAITMDVSDLEAQAVDAAGTYEAIRRSLLAVDVEETVEHLNRVGYFRRIANLAIKTTLSGLNFASSTSELLQDSSANWFDAFTPAGADRMESLDDDQIAQVFARAHHLLSQALSEAIQQFANGDENESVTFRSLSAEIVLTHARYYASQQRADGDMGSVGFIAGTDQRPFQEAMLALLEPLGKTLFDYVSEGLPTGPEGAQLLETCLTVAIEQLFPSGDESSLATKSPVIHFHPAIRGDFGEVPSDGVAWNATRVQYSGIANWTAALHDGMPTILIPFHKGKQESRHSFDRKEISAEGAWEVISRLGDRHADVLEYVHAKWLANRTEVASGSAIPIEANEILASWGIKKHVRGIYEPKQVDEVASIIADLALQTVEARVLVYGPKRTTEDEFIRETRLVLIEASDYRPLLTGERRYFRWLIRPGAWAVRTFELTKEHKQVHQAIFALEADLYYAKRIGRYLEQQWRINLETRVESPMVVNTLLRGARIDLPQTNHLRWRRRVEGQIRDLEAIKAITHWSYPDEPITQGGTKGHARWLDSTIVFGVPDHVRETYRDVAKRRKGRRLATNRDATKAS